MTDEENPIAEVFAFLEDPYQCALIFGGSILCTLLIIWLDYRAAPQQQTTPPNPMHGSGFMKGYKRPDLPKKTLKELKQLETRDESLPLYDLEELSKHKGGDSKPWVCLKGVIYDVSANEVYDQKGGYNLFSGQDASFSLATMLFDKINDRAWRTCSKEQLECLDEWVHYYKDRYKVIGYLKEEYESDTKKRV